MFDKQTSLSQLVKMEVECQQLSQANPTLTAAAAISLEDLRQIS